MIVLLSALLRLLRLWQQPERRYAGAKVTIV